MKSKDSASYKFVDAIGVPAATAVSEECNAALEKLASKGDGGCMSLWTSGGHTMYIPFWFKRGNEPPQKDFCVKSRDDMPMIGFYLEDKHVFVELKLVTEYFINVMFPLAVALPNEDQLKFKGNFLLPEEGWEEKGDGLTDGVSHGDFDMHEADKSARTGDPFTLIQNVKGITRLGFGAIRVTSCSNEQRAPRKTKDVVLETGEATVFSYRQFHKSGRMEPNQDNERVQFMCSSLESDVQQDALEIQPHHENMELCDVASKTHGNHDNPFVY